MNSYLGDTDLRFLAQLMRPRRLLQLASRLEETLRSGPATPQEIGANAVYDKAVDVSSLVMVRDTRKTPVTPRATGVGTVELAFPRQRGWSQSPGSSGSSPWH